MATDNQHVVGSDCFEMTLLVQQPGTVDQEVFAQHGLTIGRGQSNAICIDDPGVERLHARIARRDDGALAVRCEAGDARLIAESGETVPELVLVPGVAFRIGPASIRCRKRESRPTVVVAESSWKALCPRCRGHLVDLPSSATRCPSCGLAVCYFRSAGTEGGPARFAGWLPMTVGPYRIRAFAAEGGMGIVLRGVHAKTDMPAAVKLLKDSSSDPTWLARFDAEVQTLKKLVHPNIVRLQDSGRDGNMHWFATDWVDGLPVSRLMQARKLENKTIPIGRIATILRQVVDGLAYLHEHNIIHRDLKPSNVLVARDSSAKLVDLGIAKAAGRALQASAMTMTGKVTGTEGYMAPEQYEGRGATAATDVFAFGVMWHEMVTGRRPVGSYLAMQGYRHDCPEIWDAMVCQCLSYDPSVRPALSQIRAALALGTAFTATTEPVGAAQTVSLPSLTILRDEPQAPALPRKRRLAVALTIILMIEMLGGAAGYWFLSQRNRGNQPAPNSIVAATIEPTSQTTLVIPTAPPSSSPFMEPAEKAREQADAARQAAIAAGAERDAGKIFQEALASYELAAAAFDRQGFLEAKRSWDSSKGDFARAQAWAEGASKVNKARAAYEVKLSRYDKDWLMQHGGEDWKEMVAFVDRADADKFAGKFNQAVDGLAQAGKLVPKVAIRAAANSYAQAEGKLGRKDLETLAGQAWKPVEEALRAARSAELAEDAVTAIAQYQKAEGLLTQAGKVVSNMKAIQLLRRDGKISEQHLAAGTKLLQGGDNVPGESSAKIYQDLATGRLAPDRLDDALRELRYKQAADRLAAQIRDMMQGLPPKLPPSPQAISARKMLLADAQARLGEFQAADTDMAARGHPPADPYRTRIAARVSEMRRLLIDLGAPRIVLEAGGTTMQLVAAPAGRFWMGNKFPREGEPPQYEVELPRSFYVGIHEVTQEQYEGLMKANPSKFQGPQNPVDSVTWNEAIEFCKKLSAATELSARLPTEEEWEYACRAGNASVYCYGDVLAALSGYAWHLPNSGGKTRPVGQKKPNAWGLYDVHGNVAEWCSDHFSQEDNQEPVRPRGFSALHSSETLRVVRGGAWGCTPEQCRSALRGRCEPDRRENSVGFRVVVESAVQWPGEPSPGAQPTGEAPVSLRVPATPPAATSRPAGAFPAGAPTRR